MHDSVCWGFAMALAQLGLMHSFFTSKAASPTRKLYGELGVGLSWFIQIFAVLNAFATRSTHAGRVCAGDFLQAGASTAGYQVELGQGITYCAFEIAMLFVGTATIILGFQMGKLTFYRD